jgi:hypothetical protein
VTCPHHENPQVGAHCPEPDRCAHHARLRGAKHCGRGFCIKTLPDPDTWQSELDEKGAMYEPECLCPCLVCHPDSSAYHRVLWVVRELYGDEVARLMREARERLIGGEPPRDPTLSKPDAP